MDTPDPTFYARQAVKPFRIAFAPRPLGPGYNISLDGGHLVTVGTPAEVVWRPAND